MIGAPDRTRTCDPELRRLLLCPLSYEGMDNRAERQMAVLVGLIVPNRSVVSGFAQIGPISHRRGGWAAGAAHQQVHFDGDRSARSTPVEHP